MNITFFLLNRCFLIISLFFHQTCNRMIVGSKPATGSIRTNCDFFIHWTIFLTGCLTQWREVAWGSNSTSQAYQTPPLRPYPRPLPSSNHRSGRCWRNNQHFGLKVVLAQSSRITVLSAAKRVNKLGLHADISLAVVNHKQRLASFSEEQLVLSGGGSGSGLPDESCWNNPSDIWGSWDNWVQAWRAWHQCFSTISLKGTKPRPTVLFENCAKDILTQFDWHVLLHCRTKSVTPNIRGFIKRLLRSAQNAWGLHAGLRHLFTYLCSEATVRQQRSLVWGLTGSGLPVINCSYGISVPSADRFCQKKWMTDFRV